MRILFLLALLSFSTNSFAQRNILLTGFWFPTNEMLRPFSADPLVNKGEWIGKNWKNSGLDIYAFFPEFKGNDQVGTGDFPVDFGAAFNDFMRMTKALKPIAILSFGKGSGPWEIESTFPAYYQNMFVSGKIPSVLGVKPKYSIPESLKTNKPFFSSLPKNEIAKAVNENNKPHLHAWVDSVSDASNFLCGFMGYLGSWYKEEHSDRTQPDYTKFAGFIHVNGSLEESRESLDSTLHTLVIELKSDF